MRRRNNLASATLAEERRVDLTVDVRCPIYPPIPIPWVERMCVMCQIFSPRWFWIFPVTLFSFLTVPSAFAQSGSNLLDPGMGPGQGQGSIGSVDDGSGALDDPSLPGDEDPEPQYPGPIGRVDDRLPHFECDTCFTVPGLNEGRYQIFESVEVGDKEHLILRHVPNPAPLEDGEERETIDPDTGEPIWYIGRQAYVGPTDDEPFSDDYPVPKIDLIRIHYRNMDEIMSIPGVHAFGIGTEGFEVSIRPNAARNTDLVPLTIEGVPVKVVIEDMMQAESHQNARFRPVPAGAGIMSANPSTNRSMWAGTLGPHVVRHAGGCCLIWSLTAAHNVKLNMNDPNPTPGTVPIYQPTVSSGNLFGYVAKTFRLTPCSYSVSNDRPCLLDSAPNNPTSIYPDIAAIAHTPFGHYDAPPHNNPTGVEPTRRMQRSASSYINGPSGRIRTSRSGHRLVIWGSRTHVTSKVLTTQRAMIYKSSGKLYRVCCVDWLNAGVIGGDSGALVAFGGRGNRHVAGVLIAGGPLASLGNRRGAAFIPADHIKRAFQNAGMPFSHFWGTKSPFRSPSTRTCDPPGC